MSGAASAVTDFLSSPAVTGFGQLAGGIGNLASSGFDIYQGIQGINQQQQYLDQLRNAQNAQIAFTQQQAQQLRDLVFPLQEKQSQFALEDLNALRPLNVAQRDFGIERGQSAIARARELDPTINQAERNVINTLTRSEADLGRELRGQATADLQRSFGRANEQQARQLAAFGVNPASGAFQDAQARQAQAQALAEAGARTQASRVARDTALARQSQALNLRAGIPLPQQQFSPAVSASQVQSGLSDIAGRSADLAQQAQTNASQNIAGAQYSFNEALRNFRGN